MNKKIISILISLIVVAVLGMGVFWVIQSRQRTASVTIEVVPTGSTITINSKKTRQGLQKIKPQTVTVTAEKDGFETYSQTFVLNKGSKGYFGIALTPNSPSTENWYREHPEDQQLAESISSQETDRTATALDYSAPIVKALPFIGPGFQFKIDYGTLNPDGSMDRPVIFIRAISPEGREAALDWIRNRGFDVSDYKIIFNPEDAG